MRQRIFFHAVKSYDMGPPDLFPIRRKMCCGFFRPYKSIVSDGFEPATLGFSGKDTNYYTTEATTGTVLEALLMK
jgi:hypothetical protein